MNREKKTTTVERTLYRSFLLVSTLVTLMSLGLTLSYDLYRQRAEIDATISATAGHIAQLSEVVEMIEYGYPDAELTKLLDNLCELVEDINVAVIYNSQGLRFYHTDRQKTGDSYIDGEETAILAGEAPYITTGYGTQGTQRRAFHAVEDEAGAVIGFVMISVFDAKITESAWEIFLIHGVVLLVMLGMSAALCGGVMRLLRKMLLGLHPEELLGRYLRQDEVLSAVGEGLIASDAQGNILFLNTAAKHLLGISSAQEGAGVDTLLPMTRAAEIRQTGEAIYRQNWVLRQHTVLVNEIPLPMGEGEERCGVLTVLFDRTELLRTSDALFGAQSMLETLRAFNHEFSNKLHVILGYLEVGEVERAIRIITSSELLSSQHICQVADLIRCSELSALILGKMLRAAELNITLNLAADSHCIQRELLISTEDCITLVGNLLQNAMEAMGAGDDTVREITLGIYCRPDCNIVVCEDTGRGMTDQVAAQVLNQGFSTKGEGRGTGLALVNRIVTQNNGQIDIDSVPDMGTCITVTLIGEEKRPCTM